MFQFWESCVFCPPDTVEIQVVDGSVRSVTPDRGDRVTYFPEAPTVEDLFARIREATGEVDSFHAEVDPALGYRTSISIDYSSRAIGDEMAFGVLSLEALYGTSACTPPRPGRPTKGRRSGCSGRA